MIVGSNKVVVVVVLLSVLLIDIVKCFNTNANRINSNNNVMILSSSKSNDIKENLMRSLNDVNNDIYCDPETLSSLSKVTKVYGFKVDKYYNSIDFNTRYPILSNYIDFTIPEEVQKPISTLTVRELIGQNFFQNIFISSIYERGYRQNFEQAGFPGIEKEFIEINSFFIEAKAKIVLDLSCGSGFMTRKLFQSSNFDRVIGADLSPTMLAETRRRLLEEGNSMPNNILPELVRCDSARLPFKSNSLDAVHSGAALHCWPRLSQALSEINRVLKPGGVFYASTFFINAFTTGNFQRQNSGFYLFKDEDELIDLMVKAGFDNSVNIDAVNVRREGRACAIIKCKKF
jgi:SAM-dependent methyltransferase